MENITLGQIQNVLVFIIALGGSVVGIVTAVKKVLDKALKPMSDSIDALDKKIQALQEDNRKTGDMIYQMLDHLATDNNTGEMKRALDQYNQYFRHSS